LDWQLYTHALDLDTMITQKPGLIRLDLQLLAMIDDARRRLPSVQERVLMMGFSADAMFANRFTLLHPERVRAVTIGSPGGWPMVPVRQVGDTKLRYPIGTANLTEVGGRTLRLEDLRNVSMFFYLGDQDTNDSGPYKDGYDPEDRMIVDKLFGTTPVQRWPRAEELYRQAGVPATFRLYPGAGHVPNEAMDRDVFEFLQKNL
jgi:pimeloyl-ACP methyl ester carboxylesterase